MVSHNILDLLKDLSENSHTNEIILKDLTSDPSTIEEMIGVLECDDDELRTKCAELTERISEINPDILQPYVVLFEKSLDEADDEEVKGHLVNSLGNLVSVEPIGNVRGLIKSIAAHLSASNEELQRCSVTALGKIAAAQPEAAEQIFNLIISHTRYFPKAKIAVVLECMIYFSVLEHLRDDARVFVERYAISGPKATKMLARNVLGRFQKFNRKSVD